MTSDKTIARASETALEPRSDRATRVMPHTSGDLFFHIVDSAERISMFMSGTTGRAHLTDKVTRMAVERSLEIISEAVRYIPDEVKALQPEIAWQHLTDLGDRRRQHYYLVDANLLWQIAERDLPPLKAFAERGIRESGA
jgi:uncharacterized protein with HEPN domain